MNRPLALAVVTVSLAAACGAKATSEKGPQGPSAAAVSTVAPREVTTARTEEVTGTLKPARALSLGFEVGGRLAKIHVARGQKVKEGEVLAELDTEIADAQVAQAEAGLAAASAGAGLASDVAQRNERLMAQGSVSDVQSRSASTSSRQARANYLAAKAALAQARAARSRHELRAPFEGTIVGAPEQVGATVGPGMPLFTLEQLDALLLQATVPESARAQIKPGDAVTISSIAGAATTDAATVRTVVPSADPSTRRLPVDVIVPNPDGRFVAHTLARAVLKLGDPVPALALPSTALSSSGGDHVYVVAEGQVAKRVAVEVLTRGAEEVVVRAGQPLAQVINHPGPGVADGLKVAVR